MLKKVAILYLKKVSDFFFVFINNPKFSDKEFLRFDFYILK